MSLKKLKVLGVASMVLMLGMISVAQAGKIISDPPDAYPSKVGFGGWDLGNVGVFVYDTLEKEEGDLIPNDYDPDTGGYTAWPTVDHYMAFDSHIFDWVATSTPFAATSTPLMGVLHGKDFPVGEPAGIKVINDDPGEIKDPRPRNCIMTTSYLESGYLDVLPLDPVMCSSDFQTHKRFKINMMPDSLTGPGIDLVFRVDSENESVTHRNYQVLQKINNYTGERLKGFKVQLGTGVGDDFMTVSDAGGLNDPTFEKLSIWKPLVGMNEPEIGFYEADELATFSRGLFGPRDEKHPDRFPTDGFFDEVRAGFNVTAATKPGESDTFVSDGTLGSNYAQVPPLTGPPEQFGPWLHSEITPKGLFFDDDGDESTDPTLLTFWGDVLNDGKTFAWMLGEKDGFAPVPPAVLSEWAVVAQAEPTLYEVDVIEDMLNVGLNYVVTIGVVDENWPKNLDGEATFTIRVNPVVDDTGAGVPSYVGNDPVGIIPNVGTLHVSPSPQFDSGQTLDISVADANETNVSVKVENLTTGEVEDSVVLVKVDHYFLGQLSTSTDEADKGNDSGVLYVSDGDEVQISYTDAEPANTVTVTTRATAAKFYLIPIPSGGAAVIVL